MYFSPIFFCVHQQSIWLFFKNRKMQYLDLMTTSKKNPTRPLWFVNPVHLFIYPSSHSCSSNTFLWKVSLGRQSLEGDNPNEVSRDVAQIILHPNYDDDSSDNDIALLKLSSPVSFTDYVRPVCLAASDSVFKNGTDSWVTGWGRVQEGGEFCFHYWERFICKHISWFNRKTVCS